MEYLIAILATFYITTAVTSSSGPYNLFIKARKRSDLLQCFICTAVYPAAIISLWVADGIASYLVSVLAVAGGAVLLERINP